MGVTAPSQERGEAGSRLQAVRKGRKARKARKVGKDEEALAAAVVMRVIGRFWHATKDLPQVLPLAWSIWLASLV
jgi:hypothetical protein